MPTHNDTSMHKLSGAQHLDVAEDVVMEVFVIACRRLDAIPTDAQLPWLLGCARRVLANQRRGERRAQALTDRLRDSLRNAEVEPAAAEALAAALQQLSGRDQEVLLLGAWEGLTPHELGIALGCSRTAAAVRLHRARRRFAAAYSRATAGDPADHRAEVAQ
jgi:RNA polymerase sigma factor (sigma-70 family)